MARLKTCPDCGNQVSKRAEACPKCGRRMKPKQYSGCGCLILCVWIGLMSLFVRGMVRSGREAVDRPPSVGVSPSSLAAAPIVERAKLVRGGPAGNVILAIDETSFERLESSFRTNDFPSYRQLSEGNRIFGVINGTECGVIERTSSSCRVRIIGGPQDGNVGWVRPAYVRPLH